MRIFLAGATGVIGRSLVPLLVADGHAVTGTTRSAAKADALRAAGATPAVVDVYDTAALSKAVEAAKPEVVVHQLTDLAQAADPARLGVMREANARLRIDGTRNLIAAAQAAGAARIVAQSIAFIYATGPGARVETDPLGMQPDGTPGTTLRGVLSLEQQVLNVSGMTGVVLRYGHLYGPGTWDPDRPSETGVLHVDAAAQAARLALTRGQGVYNIAEDDGVFSIAKAKHELSFDPSFRLSAR